MRERIEGGNGADVKLERDGLGAGFTDGGNGVIGLGTGRTVISGASEHELEWYVKTE